MNKIHGEIHLKRWRHFCMKTSMIQTLCKTKTCITQTYLLTMQCAAVKTHPSLIKVPPQKLNPSGFIMAAWYVTSPGLASRPWTMRLGRSISSTKYQPIYIKISQTFSVLLVYIWDLKFILQLNAEVIHSLSI